MDVDGVLTNGQLHYTDQGEFYKSFSVKDGLGIKLIQQIGIKACIITGRQSKMLTIRATELGIDHMIQGREDKLVALRELCQTQQTSLDKIAYIGDDLPDLSAIISSGVGATVANAHREVIQRADWVSQCNGGDAALREFCDLILFAKGHYDDTIASYLP